MYYLPDKASHYNDVAVQSIANEQIALKDN